jgi:hypothetical protein
MEDVGIFYGRLFYFTAIWYILWSFGIFYVFFLYISPRFGMLGIARKIWQPCSAEQRERDSPVGKKLRLQIISGGYLAVISRQLLRRRQRANRDGSQKPVVNHDIASYCREAVCPDLFY